MSTPSSSGEMRPKPKSEPEVPAFDFHFNPKTNEFHPEHAQTDAYCQQPGQGMVVFPQNHDILMGQHIDLQDGFFPSFGYPINNPQVQTLSQGGPESSADTLKVGLTMVFESIKALKDEYQERIQRVERSVILRRNKTDSLTYHSELAEASKVADSLRQDFQAMTTWTRQLAAWANSFQPTSPAQNDCGSDLCTMIVEAEAGSKIKSSGNGFP